MRIRAWMAWGFGRALAIGITGAIVVAMNRGDVFSFDYVAKYAVWAGDALDGSRIPYQGFAWEYPPLAFPVMSLPLAVTGLLGESPLGQYWMVWILMLLAVDAWVLRAILARVAEPASHPAVQVWLWGPPMLGALCWVRFDLLPAAAAPAALLAAGAGRSVTSGVWAGLGASLKIWPAFFAPVQRTRRSSAIAVAVAAGFIVVVAAVTFLLTGSTGFTQVLQYQAARGLQVESLLALPLMWADRFGVADYSIQYRFGAWELVGPGTDLVATTATILYIAGVGIVGFGHWRIMKRGAGVRGIGLTAGLLIVVSMATNKVFSPQYVVWLLATVAAAAVLDPEMWRPVVKPVVAISALTQLTYPVFYPDLVFSDGWIGVLVATARDFIVIWLLVAVFARWRRYLHSTLRSDRVDVPLSSASG